jgi:hypothetical protein
VLRKAMNSLAASGFSLPSKTPNWSVQALTNAAWPGSSTGVGAAPQSTPASSSKGMAATLSVMAMACWLVARISVFPKNW